MKLKTLAAAMVLGLGSAAWVPAFAQNTGPVKIGFITDMSGLYADIDGPAGAEMVKWAVQDFGGKVLGRPVEVLTADHQNKADVASSKAREWVDKDGLSMLIGGTSSGTAMESGSRTYICANSSPIYEPPTITRCRGSVSSSRIEVLSR